MSASILLKKFLEKIINLRIIKELVSSRKSHVTCPLFYAFGFCHQNPPDFLKTRRLRIKSRHLGGGRMAWAAILNPPPPPLQQGILLFASFSWVVGDLGRFIDAKCPSWCSPSFWSSRSWVGYFLLFSPTCSIRGTVVYIGVQAFQHFE